MAPVDERVLDCVFAAIDEANEDRPDLPPLAKSPETRITGAGAELDSLALVNLLVAVEEGIERDLKVQVALTDERAVAREPSPFESVGTLIDYVEELLRERRQ